MPKSKATRLAQLKHINIRDVPRFRVVIPSPNQAKEPKREASKKKREEKPTGDANVPTFDEKARLFLGNIPTNLTKADLIEAFRSKGYAVDVTLPRRRRGVSSSFAFLQFDSIEEADKAMSSLDGLQLGDRTLVARKANARVPQGLAESG